MTDYFGNELKLNDNIITIVGKRSHYLSSARVEKISEETGEIQVSFSGTPKTKWIRPKETPTLLYRPKSIPLVSNPEYCRDCCGREISVGDKVAFRAADEIKFSEVKKIESDLWVILDPDIRVRNVSIFIII